MHPANSETTSLATAAATLHFSSLTDISRRAEKLSHPTDLPLFTLSLLMVFHNRMPSCVPQPFDRTVSS